MIRRSEDRPSPDFAAQLAACQSERILDAPDALTRGSAQEFGGTVRFNLGDSYCVTFAEAAQAIGWAERLTRSWEAIRHQEQFGCTISIGLHRGTLYTFRSLSLRPGRLDRLPTAERIG